MLVKGNHKTAEPPHSWTPPPPLLISHPRILSLGEEGGWPEIRYSDLSLSISVTDTVSGEGHFLCCWGKARYPDPGEGTHHKLSSGSTGSPSDSSWRIAERRNHPPVLGSTEHSQPSQLFTDHKDVHSFHRSSQFFDHR